MPNPMIDLLVNRFGLSAEQATAYAKLVAQSTGPSETSEAYKKQLNAMVYGAALGGPAPPVGEVQMDPEYARVPTTSMLMDNIKTGGKAHPDVEKQTRENEFAALANRGFTMPPRMPGPPAFKAAAASGYRNMKVAVDMGVGDTWPMRNDYKNLYPDPQDD